MKRKIVKQGNFSYISKISFFCFFYSILTFSLCSLTSPYSSKFSNQFFLNKLLLNDRTSNYNYRFDKIITNKICLDFTLHKILSADDNNDKYIQSLVTQINVNREGKILGYKPTKLKLISNSSEKEIINGLVKNIAFNQNKISIYWLNVTNKY